MTRIIAGLSGKMGTGKSTLARQMAKAMQPCRIMSFAEKVRQEVSARFCFDIDLTRTEKGKDVVVEHPDIPGGKATVRGVMQWWGTDVVRKTDPDYWARALLEDVNKARTDNIIIDDIRFPNEVSMVKSCGGFAVRIEPYRGWKPGGCADHLSETALDDFTGWDLVISPEYGKLKAAAKAVGAVLPFMR